MYWQFPDDPRYSDVSLQHQPVYYDMTVGPAVNSPYNGDYYSLYEDEAGIKRPMNSFLLWAKVMRKKFAKDNPTLHNAEISKLLGKVWNSMTTVEKRPFVERAEKLRVLHMRDHPNYRYAPKKKKERKQAQRMISPEVAAAFHNSIFDLKASGNVNININGIKPSETGLSQVQNNMILGRPIPRTVLSIQNMPLRNNQKGHQTSQISNSSQTFNVFESLQDGVSTLHYFPHSQDNNVSQRMKGNSSLLSAGAGNPGECNGYSDNSKVHEIYSDRISFQPKKQTNMLDKKTAFRPTASPPFRPGSSWSDSASTSDCESIVPSSPESNADSLDDDMPPFLRAILDFPFHMTQASGTAPGCDDGLLSDLGEIIGKEELDQQSRKACMYS